MPAADNERGVALLAVVGILLAVLPLAAAVAIETQLDVFAQRNARSGAIAFYAAEAGLAHARADLRPSLSLATLLDGPDTTPGTADDGIFPFRTLIPADFALPTLGYEVTANGGPGNMIRLRSRGRGPHGSIREVEALVAPRTTPFTPGAVYVESSNVDVDLGAGGFLLSGAAPAGTDGIVGLAVSSSTAAIELRSSIPPEAATGTGGAPSVAATPPAGLWAAADALQDRADAMRISASGGGPSTLGNQASPQLTIIDGDWAPAQPIDGFGILLVRGALVVGDRLTYRGLVIVEGGIEATSASELQIDGALWTRGGSLQLIGAGSVRYSPSVLIDVDDAIAGALLHVPEVVAWHEVS